jgi:hypothetical protein
LKIPYTKVVLIEDASVKHRKELQNRVYRRAVEKARMNEFESRLSET